METSDSRASLILSALRHEPTRAKRQEEGPSQKYDGWNALQTQRQAPCQRCLTCATTSWDVSVRVEAAIAELRILVGVTSLTTNEAGAVAKPIGNHDTSSCMMLISISNSPGVDSRGLTNADLLTRHEGSTKLGRRDLRQIQRYNMRDLTHCDTCDDAPGKKICDTLCATAKSTSYSE